MWQNQAILTDTVLVLDGRLGELGRMVAEVAGFCRDHGLAEEVEFDLDLALEELFTNSLRHGGCEGIAGAVRICLHRAPDGVWVEYADRGRPFDPLTAPSPDVDAALEDRTTGGLGVHLVRQTMSDIEYQREDGWNRVRMRRPF